ncbi:fused MFS/spermidine synthase [Blastopirellula sp. JC732]|uniref:Fused MFS/spermidine synthase n=1 Tax=Blastopirellula sediminis TaxID=2894196 RepID=A0A9X1MQV3_9BACT|nr:fused MFS/spermidine synthase [Blastopirellula sediminis]MCC9606789.1 fused MFS/spermidine synthase [Blastopirellula sediminis]MCC9629914.1 fused MFS/spermidine synthase [Blastopirellula sediminis]
MFRLPELLRCCFAAAVFVSALLLFQIQPIVSKAILPWFGGSPAVWTTAMLFFQVVLFLGYLYAHLTTRYLPLLWQGAVHLLLVIAAAVLSPVLADISWKPSPEDAPALRILLLLTATIGLPYFLLAANGPLLQAWFGRRFPGVSPYRLYALSNVGSLLALLSYPFVIEPNFAVSTQAAQWSIGFGLFAALLAIVVWQLRSAPAETPTGEVPTSSLSSPAISWRTRAKWLLLPAWASFGLLAVTNHVCQDMAVVPLLWVAPLSLYLLTFILAFDSEGWYRRETVAWLTMASLAGVALVDWSSGSLGLVAAIGVYFASLFFACFACHGELVRLKPEPARLTEFYLTISAGGALGGVLVSLICPMALTDYFESPIFILGSFLIAGGILFSATSKAVAANPADQPTPAPLPKRLAWAIPLLLVVVYGELRNFSGDYLVSRRNFYGVLHVDDQASDGERRRMMFHGHIVHGFQFLDDKRRTEPTSYYAPETGVGIVLSELSAEDRPLRVGVVGLGAGTLAAYGKPGDTFRMYEINPEVVELAEDYFSYLKDSPAKVEIVLGDGRLSLEAETNQKFDLLVLDAFSGDAIPTHLLTREAFDIYRQRLAPNGVIAVHISNMHVDLRPVVEGLANDCDLQTLYFVAAPDVAHQKTGAHWVIATNNRALLASETIRRAVTIEPSQLVVDRLWTDDYSNLLNVLK